VKASLFLLCNYQLTCIINLQSNKRRWFNDTLADSFDYYRQHQDMMFGDIGAYTPKFAPTVERSISLNVDIGDIQMYEVNDPETFAINLKDALKHNVAVRNIIPSDTLGVMTGKNSLTKFKY